MENENAVAVVGDVKFDLALARAPKQVLAEAQDAAKALQSVISTRKNAVKFNGKHYLSFEDWQTCGRFYGVTAKIISTEQCEMDGVKGFIARAEAINTQTGQVISAAESMCMNDEPNWSRKPLFQLRSMAQTRAAAKSLRNCLAWVVVLAGYEPSVAEEMTGDEQPSREPVAPPTPKSDVTAGVVEDVSSKPTSTGGTRYGVKIGGDFYGTFTDAVGIKAMGLKGKAVRFTWAANAKKPEYRDLLTIEAA